MLRALCLTATSVFWGLASTSAQVQNVGDVSFSVPSGWQYQQGADVGAMILKTDNRFWLAAVYSATPSSGDPNADFKVAWKRVVFPLPNYGKMPGYDPYSTSKMIGYSGKYYDASSATNTSYTRLYVLETGKVFIPVSFTSNNRNVLDSMSHNERAITGSVRVAPRKASPIRFSVTVSDLAGYWIGGIVTSTDYYNNAGQYQSNSLTAVNYGYTIASNGTYTYKFGGLMNNRPTKDDDSGVVELQGEFVTFKGHQHVRRYRFVNLQEALDGSTVLALWPAVDLSQIDSNRDTEYLTRALKK
ncbi:MAG TPA: hypothetical protein VNU92_13945 [Edaphobacter sp.]|jgi:hypothetical protein|nr:hypothetical protein [Edaphobacter sp.]